MTILIVEDDAISASYLEQMLEEEGFTIVGNVETGRDAIKMSKKLKPDLVLMDIMLKDAISGIDAALQIQRVHSDIKIIYLTAYAESNIVDEAIKSHACAYFLKPYNKLEILANLKILQAEKDAKTESKTSIVKLISQYHYCLEHKQLYCNNKEVYLSQKEQKAIDYLCKHTHTILVFDKLISHIWGENGTQENLRSLIRHIRIKTEYDLIVNINKIGYRVALGEV